MTGNTDSFDTAIRDVQGTWPTAPPFWSYSSLKDAEECPRRWALTRATYPAIWENPGYPPRPIQPAIVGDIVHRALDLILRALHERGCASIADPTAVEAIKRLGGYSTLIEQLIEGELKRLETNPRMENRLAAIRASLQARVPDMRRRVQTTVVRTQLTPAASAASLDPSTATATRAPLPRGSHPEVSLKAPQVRLAGRADLLTVNDEGCAIVDYKTGQANEHHAEQLRLYALLWDQDSELNPDRLPVTALTLVYATQDEQVEPPTAPELDTLASELRTHIAAVEDDIARRPPPARPEASVCHLCHVRHLCEEYWGSVAGVAPVAGSFADRQGTIVSQNGPRSWMIETQPARQRVLLRTPTEDPGFMVGDRVRLLDVVVADDEEADTAAISLTQVSEIFQLADS